TLVQRGADTKNIALLVFPVGFVNVVESKEYTMEFLDYFNAEGIVMRGRFGSSTMAVASLHAIYRLI
ncbi:MAG: precorrin-8X methylmutase, partial [Epsilonproteobacteria bacterium]|nr:precorrin-8X methylmutase [Campylobacterota bacterium]